MRRPFAGMVTFLCLSLYAGLAKAAEQAPPDITPPSMIQDPQESGANAPESTMSDLEYSDAANPVRPGFVRAVAIDRRKPSFPRGALLAGAEGWVILAHTITPDGAVEDARVLDSIGPPVFRDVALKTLEGRRYRPATQDGVPVAQSVVGRITFRISCPGTCKEARQFVKTKYDHARKLLDDGKSQAAIDTLAEAQKDPGLNFYERAMMSALQGYAAATLDDFESARRFFSRALWKNGAYLEESWISPSYRGLVVSDTKLGHFAEGVGAFDEMENAVAADEQDLRDARDAITAANATLANPSPFAVQGRILTPDVEEATPDWRHKVSRKSIGFLDLKGQLDGFTIRCDAKTVKGKISDQLEYKLPDSWNKCTVTVTGAPGATFTLVEYP